MGTRKHVKRPSILMNFPCYFRATFKGARIFTACDNQQGKVCERYTGRNISRQVRLLSAGLKASQSLTTWMFVPNIQTMLDSNAPKNVFFSKKHLFEDAISIWKEMKGAESFNPIEKCGSKIRVFTKIEPNTKKTS